MASACFGRMQEEGVNVMHIAAVLDRMDVVVELSRWAETRGPGALGKLVHSPLVEVGILNGCISMRE